MLVEEKIKIYYTDEEGNIVRDSNELDIVAMKDRLRKPDVNEVWASHHHTPEEALKLSFVLSSRCFTIETKRQPIAMFGVVPKTLLGSDRATIWLLATDELKTVRRKFLLGCRSFINGMLKEYLILENYIDARNTESIRWLKWCGAIIEEAKPMGAENLLFHYFYFRRTD